MKLAWSALGAQVGDKIYDKRANKIGIVVKKGQSGNYDTLYIDFGGKNPRRIIPIKLPALVNISSIFDAPCYLLFQDYDILNPWICKSFFQFSIALDRNL